MDHALIDGRVLRRFIFPIESGMVRAFAAALGAPADRVPPTFLQAASHFDPEYHLRPSSSRPWFGSGANPTGDAEYARERSASLHAEQEFEFFGSIAIGDTLQVIVRDGGGWTKASTKRGVLDFTAIIHEFRSEDDVLVARSTTTAVTVKGQK
jgi:hypothetical protein